MALKLSGWTGRRNGPRDGDGVSSIPARPVLDNEIAEHRPSPVGGCRGDIR